MGVKIINPLVYVSETDARFLAPQALPESQGLPVLQGVLYVTEVDSGLQSNSLGAFEPRCRMVSFDSEAAIFRVLDHRRQADLVATVHSNPPIHCDRECSNRTGNITRSIYWQQLKKSSTSPRSITTTSQAHIE